MIKKITKRMIGIYLIIMALSQTGSFVYAQSDCSICNGPHQTLQEYESFVFDILNEIKTYAIYGKNAGANGTP
jgi:hypothetical protein